VIIVISLLVVNLVTLLMGVTKFYFKNHTQLHNMKQVFIDNKWIDCVVISSTSTSTSTNESVSVRTIDGRILKVSATQLRDKPLLLG